MVKRIISEANRCLKCSSAKCSRACPVNTPIDEMMRLLEEGKIKQAGQLLFENNPLSLITSLVCPHERFCQGACVLGNKSVPIDTGSIEHYVSKYYLGAIELKKKTHLMQRVAVIGSGPSGLTVAFLMALKGYKVTIFESNNKIGGVLRFGIPEFRLPKTLIDLLKDKLVELGVKIRPNTLIGKVITVDDLFSDGYKAVFIGTGVWKPYKLNIKGETLGNVHFAIDYLKHPQDYNLGKKVTIIGAGNVAMDVARTCIRRGVEEVTVMYRKTKDYMKASNEEINAAALDGVHFELLKTPVEFTDSNIIYNKVVQEGEKFVQLKNKSYTYPTDSTVIAISQGPQANIVSTTQGIEVTHKGLVSINRYGETTRQGVFASGDVVTGAKTVVEAVKLSKIAAEKMDHYIANNYDYVKKDLTVG